MGKSQSQIIEEERDKYRTALRGILRLSTDPAVRERARLALTKGG